jgi:2-succinyl-6-hydroxy-2,4-cyclohexadiene-1-carboxylate synthase
MSRLRISDVALNVEMDGAPRLRREFTAPGTGGAPLVLLHGFTGGAENWRPLSAAWAGRFRTIAVDLLGHGRSDAPADPARYRMERCVADLAAALDQLGQPGVSVLGYSMGGRIALHFAAAYPERVRALVLESASPGLAAPEERAARVAADEALARQLERDGLEAFVDYWERLPLFASQARLPESVRAVQRAQRLCNNPQGLANSLRGLGTGAQPSLWERLPELHAPTLLVAGALDAKFTAIARQMAAALPAAQLASVPEAGHTVHLERPDVFATLVADFLRDQAGPTQ